MVAPLGESRVLCFAGRLFEQRDAAPTHPLCDRVAEKLHDPRQVDLDAHDIVQHLDPAGDPLPHCRRDKVQGVPFPVVIGSAEKSVELGPQPADAVSIRRLASSRQSLCGIETSSGCDMAITSP